MKKSLKFIIIGGDSRQIYLANQLQNDGHSVLVHAIDPALCPDIPNSEEFPSLSDADVIVLPLPAFREHLQINAPLYKDPVPVSKLADGLSQGQIVVAGYLPNSFVELSRKMGVHTIDYFEREEMAVLNAIPTAEGACAIAMEELPITLHRAKVLVIGFGRIGKILAHRLDALGCDVTVSARKYSDFAWIEAYGYSHADTNALGKNLSEFDIIFNTVPAMVLSRARLATLKKDCLVIDLASKPGGVDFQAATELGTTVIWALSLPGKCSPLTSGRIICDTIYHILEEQGVFDDG
jgi:dipicolinate synthase subunit A